MIDLVFLVENYVNDYKLCLILIIDNLIYYCVLYCYVR
jgi:hypothetical protein